MVDPILSTGLATDWLKRLHNLWSTLRKTREGELQEIQNVFGDPKHLADYYIEPDCQPVNPADHDEDESIRAFRQPVRFWLNRFLEGEFLERDGRNTVFVLSDAGMGKTSLLMMLKLTHLMKFWPDGLDFRLMKLGPDTLERLAKIQNHAKTVLLLDSLDEDSSAWGRVEERLIELLDATKSFRQVILTCRTQFFPEGNAAPIEAPYKVVVGGYICNILYVSPFDNTQVEAYLRNVYPNRWQDLLRKLWRKEDNPKLVRARRVVEPMRSLRMRPMLLAHIDDLMQSDVQEWREFPVYDVLVRRWLLREQRKHKGKYTEDQLWELCEEVAIFLQRSGTRVLSLEDLEAIRKTLPVAETLEAFDIGGRSLLNRTSDEGFRFSHYSIQEFLVARRLVRDCWMETSVPLRATEQLLSFLLSWAVDAENLPRICWAALDMQDVRFSVDRTFLFYPSCGDERIGLQGVYLRGARIMGDLSGVDLKNAWLEEAFFSGASLKGANLRGARLVKSRFYKVNLQAVDARGVDFSDCLMNECDLSFGRFSRATFDAASFVDVSSKGAGFLLAAGLRLPLDETAGPPIHRFLNPTLLIHADNDETESGVVPGFGSVSIRAGKDFFSSSVLHRSLTWSSHGLFSFGGLNREIGLWSSAGRLALLGSRLDIISSMTWAPQEKNLFIVGASGSIEQWDMDTLQCFKVTKRLGDTLAIRCYDEETMLLASSSGSRILATDQEFTSEPFTIRILDLQTEREIAELPGHSCGINCLAWKQDNTVLASAAADGTVRLWDLSNLNIGGEYFQHAMESSSGPISSLAWNPAGTLLVAVLGDGSIDLWHGGTRILSLRYSEVPQIANFVWAPKKERYALLGRSREVALSRVGTLGRTLIGASGHAFEMDFHTDKLPVPASAVAWNSQGDLLALAVPSGAIEIWDVSGAVPQLLLSLFETPPFQGLVITADGYVDGPPETLQYVRFADGEALYDLEDLPERHDPERVRQAMSILSP